MAQKGNNEQKKAYDIKYRKEKQHRISLYWKKDEFENEILPVIKAFNVPIATYIKDAVLRQVYIDKEQIAESGSNAYMIYKKYIMKKGDTKMHIYGFPNIEDTRVGNILLHKSVGYSDLEVMRRLNCSWPEITNALNQVDSSKRDLYGVIEWNHSMLTQAVEDWIEDDKDMPCLYHYLEYMYETITVPESRELFTVEELENWADRYCYLVGVKIFKE